MVRLETFPGQWKSARMLAGTITRWGGAELTRLEMLQWLKEHELAHRMQLYLCLRMNGVVPLADRRRMEQQKKRG